MSTIKFYACTICHFYDVKEYLIHTVDAATVNTEAEMERQALESPLALVQPPGVIMGTPPTPPQPTGMLALIHIAVCTVNFSTFAKSTQLGPKPQCSSFKGSTKFTPFETVTS